MAETKEGANYNTYQITLWSLSLVRRREGQEAANCEAYTGPNINGFNVVDMRPFRNSVELANHMLRALSDYTGDAVLGIVMFGGTSIIVPPPYLDVASTKAFYSIVDKIEDAMIKLREERDRHIFYDNIYGFLSRTEERMNLLLSRGETPNDPQQEGSSN